MPVEAFIFLASKQPIIVKICIFSKTEKDIVDSNYQNLMVGLLFVIGLYITRYLGV